MEITAKDFPYNTGLVSRKAYDDHMTLYKGYVQKTNEITQVLATNPEWDTANATASHYRGWKKSEPFAIDGVILHELYFQNLGSETVPIGEKIQDLLTRYFGSVDNWKKDFTACAKAARGWCVLVYEQRTCTCRNILLDAHDNGNIMSAYPILVLDMYEHAYFIDYGTDKAAYIENFIKNIPWGMIEKRAAMIS
ncbi:MAG: Fe-Mn family superoxide dismutase [Defluviitaleaceae bacterium]|nr:Fe-Mn family superoxide dismutase [Defluviitaleaceae bacterium]